MNLSNKKNQMFQFLQEIAIEELPLYSEWPKRIFEGVDGNFVKQRTSAKVFEEYTAKWNKLLVTFTKEEYSSLEECLWGLIQSHFPEQLLIHQKEKVFLAKTNMDFWEYYYKIILAEVNTWLSGVNTIVEIGSGWGRNLFYFLNQKICKQVIGGEFVTDGIKLGKMISEKFDLPADFFKFDYNNPSDEISDYLNGALVFTHNSIEQIPYLKTNFIEYLIKYKPKVVIHFEPVYELNTQNHLMHLMWKKYTEINDYNRNLLSLLKSFEDQGKIKILDIKLYHFGLNAFNGGSLIVWTPI